MKKLFAIAAIATVGAVSLPALAADYVIDKEGQHASVHFKIQHLGYSWLLGRFNDFEGTFSYDSEDVGASKVNVTVDTSSIDSNHAERDKHLRSDDFLHVDEYPQAKFVSTEVMASEDNAEEFKIKGDLTLHGVTKSVILDVEKVGEGKDPWGGYRAGFKGKTEIKLKDFGIDYDLGPASETVYLELHVEGVKQ